MLSGAQLVSAPAVSSEPAPTVFANLLTPLLSQARLGARQRRQIKDQVVSERFQTPFPVRKHTASVCGILQGGVSGNAHDRPMPSMSKAWADHLSRYDEMNEDEIVEVRPVCPGVCGCSSVSTPFLSSRCAFAVLTTLSELLSGRLCGTRASSRVRDTPVYALS
jgi:hypothetical protein